MQCIFCSTKEPVTVWKIGEKYCVVCTECNARGPERDTEAAAKSIWGRVVARDKRLQKPQLSLTDREKDMLELCKEALRYKRAKPSTSESAKKLGVHPNMIPRYYKSLIRKGWIRMDKDRKQLLQVYGERSNG